MIRRNGGNLPPFCIKKTLYSVGIQGFLRLEIDQLTAHTHIQDQAKGNHVG